MKRLALVLSILMVSCSSMSRVFTSPSTTDRVIGAMESPVAAGTTCSPMLGWLGGICTLGGMALLVITGGKMGWRPLIGGILFVVLNYALALYASWFFLPVVIATGMISLAWAWKIVLEIYKEKKQ